MAHRILIVDDDELVLMATSQLLKKHGYQVDVCMRGSDAVQMVKEGSDPYALIILDYQMDDQNGATTAQMIRNVSPDLFVLIYSGDSSRDALKQAWSAGAIAFLEKGGNAEEFLNTVADWCRKFDETVCTLSPYCLDTDDYIAALNMVGRSKALRHLGTLVERYRKSPANVLVLGETGTGKELLARALHLEKTGSFVAVNCAAFKDSSDLIESELFGHERGAFTGAVREKIGLLESAQGGTVFLDEVHHLSLAAQAKLLRAVQEKKIRRVGGNEEYDVSFRLISAAKPDLESRCEKGEFLGDLYHRLNVLTLHVSPLRERPEDIEPLIAHFSRKFFKNTEKRATFLMNTLRYLEKYPWPGNVRELENTVYRLLTECTGKIEPKHLEARFFAQREDKAISYEAFQRELERQEKQHIEAILKASRSKLEAARKLNISPSTLHSIMKRMGLYRTDSP